MGSVLSATGFHQPGVWQKGKFKAAGNTVIASSRFASTKDALKKQRVEDEGEGNLNDQITHAKSAPSTLVVGRMAERHISETRIASSRYLFSRTLLTKLLHVIDPTMLENDPRAVNELSTKGTAFVALCSTLGCHMLRLLLRDVLLAPLLDQLSTGSKNVALKRKLLEVYALSLTHALGCATYSLSKLLFGRWNSPAGAQGMLCFSLGFTSYNILALRTQLLTDPIFGLNEVAWLFQTVSFLRSEGVEWLMPLFMATHIPTTLMFVLRLMAELGVSHSNFIWRFTLGAFTTSFIAIKGCILPTTFARLTLRGAREYPELHQPHFLLAKLCFSVRMLTSYGWLAVLSRYFRSATWAMHPEASYVASTSLPRLRYQLKDTFASWRALASSYNPLSLFAFAALQSAYFVGPASVPALFYALIKKPKYRVGASSGLAALLALTFWPMRADVPFKPSAWQAHFVSSVAGAIKSYFPFKSVIEEPFQHDRRYLVASVPHGMMPMANVCLGFELQEQGFFPNAVGASVLLQIPVLRQMFRTMNLVPANKKSVLKTLQRTYPHNITFIVPGGIAEMFLMRDDLEQVFIKSRKGFIKLALQTGTDVVPMYGLGVTELYTVPNKESRLGKFCMDLSRRLQMSLIPFVGRWGLPLLPYAKPLTALVGKPLRVEVAVPNPTPEQIDELHGRFLEELRRIFETHKHLVPGYEEKRLYFEDEDVPALPQDPVIAEPLFPSAGLNLSNLSSKL